MPGFSLVTGQQAIMYADNASFDGSNRGGALSANGQIWIGSSVAPFVRVGNITSSGGSIIVSNNAGNINLETSAAASGTLVQYKYFTDNGAYFSTATTFTLPSNTAPSNTDGAAFMSGSITPLSASNLLVVRFQTATYINVSAGNSQASWLLRDASTTATAVRVVAADILDICQHELVYSTTAGSTAPTTFHVRVGVQAGGGGTLEINGLLGAGTFSGAVFSTLEILEITP